LAAVVLESWMILEREKVSREAAAVVLDLCASRLTWIAGASFAMRTLYTYLIGQ
jgi:hypothetical protein